MIIEDHTAIGAVFGIMLLLGSLVADPSALSSCHVPFTIFENLIIN